MIVILQLDSRFPCAVTHYPHRMPICSVNRCLSNIQFGLKYTSEAQQEYNDVHGFYCARVGHLFAACCYEGSSTTCGWVVPQSCMAMCVFCKVIFVFGGKLGFRFWWYFPHMHAVPTQCAQCTNLFVIDVSFSVLFPKVGFCFFAYMLFLCFYLIF